MVTFPRSTRISNLSKTAQHNLEMYALGAAAAGVGLMSLTLPADGEIVYTPTHCAFARHLEACSIYYGKGNLNVNLIATGGSGSEEIFASSGTTTYGQIHVAVQRENGKLAVAMFPGARIAESRHFGGLPLLARGTVHTSQGPVYWIGPWADGGKGVKNRYLGIKVKAQGEVHFGWARLTVRIPDPKSYMIDGLLTGYAFETIPNKPIKAGQTKEADEQVNTPAPANSDDPGEGALLTSPTSDEPQLASLGMLALGNQGIAMWRRKEQENASNLS